MSDPPPIPPGARTFFAAAVSIGLLWQALLIVLAFQHAEPLGRMLREAAIQPPVVTRLFLSTYPFWPAGLVLSAIAVFAPIRRQATSQTTLAFMAAVPLLVALFFQVWTNEAVVAPLYDIIRRLQ